jgi:hypothetical protein
VLAFCELVSYLLALEDGSSRFLRNFDKLLLKYGFIFQTTVLFLVSFMITSNSTYSVNSTALTEATSSHALHIMCLHLMLPKGVLLKV